MAAISFPERRHRIVVSKHQSGRGVLAPQVHPPSVDLKMWEVAGTEAAGECPDFSLSSFMRWSSASLRLSRWGQSTVPSSSSVIRFEALPMVEKGALSMAMGPSQGAP